MRRLTVLVLLWAVGCFPSDYASHPELDLRVVDASGAAMADAEVVTYSWSNPHHRLDHERSHTTDAAGNVTASGQSQREWVAPLCIHGVAEHHMTICVSKPGYRAVQVELVDPEASTTLAVALTPDPSGTRCSYGAGRFGGAARPDITGPNVDGAWEVEPAPAGSASASGAPIGVPATSASAGR